MHSSLRTAAIALALIPAIALPAAAIAQSSQTTVVDPAKSGTKKTHTKIKKGVDSEQTAAAASNKAGKTQQDPLDQRGSPEPPPPPGSGISPTTPSTNKTAK